MRKSDPRPCDHARAPERVFEDDERWFVRTREGMRGPFGSRAAAESEAALFVDTVMYLQDNQPAVPDDVDPDDITVVDMDKAPWR